MIGQREIIILVGTLAIIGGSFAYGYHKGSVTTANRFEDKRIELQEEILDLNEYLSVLNAENLLLRKEKEDLINDLEKQALNAEGASAPGVATTGGLYRLERRWGPSPTSSQ